MASVTLTNVQKTYSDGHAAVKDFNLDIADGEFIVLVGPSGCGKSTTLRMVAGLEDISSGSVAIDGRVVNSVHPKDRDIAMVFQNYALYPHMSVRENIAFSLKLRSVPREEIARRVQAASAMLGLDAMLDKKPKALSGGQRQRVAVGRAIVREPKVFLFDEPLSNLDARLRVTTRAEIKSLQMRLKTTTIYVTHDQEEAMTMGDRIVVMHGGIVQQAGTPMDVYLKPANRFVAGFLGTPPMNFIPGLLAISPTHATFTEHQGPGSNGGVSVALPAGWRSRLADLDAKPCVLGVRPQQLHDTETAQRLPEAARLWPTITVTATLVEPLGDAVDVTCKTSMGTSLVARLHPRAGLKVGATLKLAMDLESCAIFETGELGRNRTA